MANIVLDARSIHPHPTGVGRYVRALVPELQRLAGDRHRFSLIRNARCSDELGIDGVAEVFEQQRHDTLDHVLVGRWRTEKHLRAFDADLYHSFFHILPMGLASVPTVMTMHDFIWVDQPELAGMVGLMGSLERRIWTRVLRQSLGQAQAVIHVSETTRRRAKSFLGRGWDARQHHVVHHGVAEEYFEGSPPLTERWREVWERGPVVVCVGNAKPYKNLAIVIEAAKRMSRDDVQLVLIGNCDGLAEKGAGLGDRLHMAGIADDDELHALVGAADAFVFPSLFEGFGMPPLEAMAMGRPTFVSARDPMLEVCAGGAETFAPLDATELADKLEAALGDPEALEAAGRRAREHASKFRWRDSAEETLAVYEEVLGSRA